MIVAGPTGNPLLKTHAIGACVCLAIAAGGYILGLQPMMHGPPPVVDLRDDIDQAREELDLSEAQLTQRHADLEAARRLVQDQAVALSPASTLNARLADLSDLAQSHDLSVTGTQVDPLDETGSFAFIPVNISGEGSYANATGFIGDLRTRFPDMGMATFKLSREGQEGAAHFELELNWFVVPPQSAQAGE